ncbi:MAG: YdcF family protein [Eubacteriales bacterium]|nr:YdcF family protein [Eubacteriales bacterium]
MNTHCRYRWFDIFWMGAGLVLALGGIAVWAVSSFNLGHVLMLCLAAFTGGCGAFGPWLRAHAPLWLRAAVLTLVGLELCLRAFLFTFGRVPTVTGQEDAILVLGAGIRGERVSLLLGRRLDAAYDAWMQNPSALLVLSGGQGPDEAIPEAVAMKRYLLARGVPEGCILTEEASTSTRENFSFSKTLLDQRFPQGYSAAFVTTDFHAYRADRIAREEGLHPTRVCSTLLWYQIPMNYLRESVGVLKLWTWDQFAFQGVE